MLSSSASSSPWPTSLSSGGLRRSTPLHFLTISDIAAVFSLIASVFYLVAFFGIAFILHPFAASGPIDYDDEDEPNVIAENAGKCLVNFSAPSPSLKIAEQKPLPPSLTLSMEDEEVIRAVVLGLILSYSLESKLGDCRRAAGIHHQAVESVTRKSLEGLPVEGLDYDSILRQWGGGGWKWKRLGRLS